MKELPIKTDLVVWVQLTEIQKKIYQYIQDHNQMKIALDEAKGIQKDQDGKKVRKTSNALVAINLL